MDHWYSMGQEGGHRTTAGVAPRMVPPLGFEPRLDRF
jgi:hypothetical protein